MDSMLDCEICLHRFNCDKRRPRSLPCGHTMCSSCLTDILQAKAGCIDCPFCRSSFGDDPKTTSDFVETIVILKHLEARNQTRDNSSMWRESMINNAKDKLENLRQTELDGTLAHTMTCKEHLADLQQSKQKQESEKQHLAQQRNDLLEELQRINEQEIQIDADLQGTEESIAIGADLLRRLESIQECIKSACSVVGVKMAAQDAENCYSATAHWSAAATKSCNSGIQSPQLDSQEFDSDAEAACEPSPSPPEPQNSVDVPIENGISNIGSIGPSVSVAMASNIVINKGARSREDSPVPALSDISLDRGLPYHPQLQSHNQMPVNVKSPNYMKGPPHLRKVFVGGLHINTNEETLARYFSEYGEVIDVALKFDAGTNRSKGYAFIEFTSPEMVDNVRRAQPHKIDGRVVDTKRAKPNPKHQDVQEDIQPKMTWTRMFRTQGCRSYKHTGVTCEHQIFSFGACTQPHNNKELIEVHTLRAWDIFDSSDQWKFLSEIPKNIADVPPPLHGHSANAWEHCVYIWGGCYRGEYFNTLYCFDTKTKSWSIPSTRGPEPDARRGHAACMVRHFMFIFSGYKTPALHSLDLRAMTWKAIETTGEAPTAREDHTMVNIGNCMYVWGGRKPSGEECEREVYCLDTIHKHWTVIDATWETPETRYNHSAVVYKEQMYVFGGMSLERDAPFNDLHAFDPRSGSWQQLNPRGTQPPSREGHICVMDGPRMIIQGGQKDDGSDDSIFDDTWMLVLN